MNRRLKTIVKGAIRRPLNRFGLDIIRSTGDAGRTLAGLNRLPIRSIIDVGAHTGEVARQLLRTFPAARCYCFEPQPGPAAALRHWAERQQGRATVFELALGEQPGETEMFVHVDHTSSSSLLPTTRGFELTESVVSRQEKRIVAVRRLDEVIQTERIELLPDILIKVDAQGYDDRVIRGGSATFRHAAACIVEAELDHLYEGQFSFAELVNLLGGLGFAYAGNLGQGFAVDGHIATVDAVFVHTGAAW